MRYGKLAFFLLAFFLIAPVQADLILTSAPRDTQEKEEEIYKPITDLMSKAIGQKVVFRYGDNFLVYQSEMRKGNYDIIFDGPHFVGWRMEKLNHVPMVKFPGNLVFSAITSKKQEKINDLKGLIGRTVCAFPPPNLATLSILVEFDNPSRQPLVLETETFPAVYKKVMAGKCVGGILQTKLFQNLDKDAKAGKVLFTSKPLPNQTFSAGPKVTPEMRDKITKAMLSPEGAAATQKLRDVFKVQANMQPATEEEFKDLGKLLRDVWGFDL